MSTSNLHLNSRVQVSAGSGTLRFLGPTQFSEGTWAGIELDEANGKNDGSVAGVRYFMCEMGYGVFTKAGLVKSLEDEGEMLPPPLPAPIPSSPMKQPRPASRPSSVLNRPSSVLSTTSSQRTSGGAGSSRPSSTPRASISATPKRPLPLSSSGRSSVASTTSTVGLVGSKASTSTGRIGATQPLKVGTTAQRTGLSSTTSSTRASIVPSNASTSTTTGLKARPRPSVASLPPPTPLTTSRPPSRALAAPTPIARALPRPISPQKSTPVSSIQNFAPASGGTPRPATGGGHSRTLSGISSTGSAISSRRLSTTLPSAGLEIQSPTLRAARILSASPSRPPVTNPLPSMMMRTHSKASSYGGGSLVDEERPEEFLEEQEGREVVRDVKEENDPFSLRGIDSRRTAELTIPKKEYDSALAKILVLERRRAEDREKLKEFERYKNDSTELVNVIESGKTKITSLTLELRTLRTEHKAAQTELTSLVAQNEDLADQFESGVLDKEMAEEKFETCLFELKGVKEKLEEVMGEVEGLREENQRMAGIGDEELAKGSGGADGSELGGVTRSSIAFVQLEKQNVRLKDALYGLRNSTAETEAEDRKRIVDLEKELDLTLDLQTEFETTSIELERAEALIEDLKAQLDDALGAEEMLEQLTDRNLTLSDRVEELDTMLEEMEEHNALNDELEEAHIETEKQMQEEIDLKESQLRDQLRRIETFDENAADFESTISQFRELVMSLQSDLEQLKQQQASQETESQSLTSQSQAMLNLNLKLQSSVTKGQVKTIDLELRKLDAIQASERIAILHPYLMPSFFENDSDALDSLMFFERLAYKTDLISMIIEQTHSVTDSLNSVVPENLVGLCETRARLSKFSSLNKRFAAQLKRCSPELFIKMGRVYQEVLATEKKIDFLIDSLRREEFKESDCDREMDGFIAQASHLAQIHLQDSLLDLSESEIAHIAVLELDFDTIAVAAGFTKQALVMIAKDPDVLMEVGDSNLDEMLFKPLQSLVNQARNSKVVTKKLIRRMEELAQKGSALSHEYLQGFETLSFNGSAIAIAASKLATSISSYCTSIRISKAPFQISAVLSLAQEITSSEFGKQSGKPLDEIYALLLQLAQNLGTTLSSALEGHHAIQLAYVPPWIERVKELQSTAAINGEAERQVTKLGEEIKVLVREMRSKDQANQEAQVKIDHMSSRMESVKKQSEEITSLRGELLKAKDQDKAYEEALDAANAELDVLEKENGSLKAREVVLDSQGATNRASDRETSSTTYEGNLETSRLLEQIEALRLSVRYLRSENSYLKSQDLLAKLDDLPTYALPPTPPDSPPRSKGVPGGPISRDWSSLDPVVQKRAFMSESRSLLQEARVLSSTPRLVDLSLLTPRTAGVGETGWRARRRNPVEQLEAERERTRNLGRKVERLLEMRPASLMRIS